MNRMKNQIYIFRTSNKYSRQQFIAVNLMILGLVGVLGIVLFGPMDPDESPLWGYFIVAACLAGLFGFALNYVRWPKEIYHAQIEGTVVRGENLFGKEISFDIHDIVRIGKNKLHKTLEFVTAADEAFIFCGGIDFSGFLYDHILELNPSISFPSAVQKESREDPNFWAYTRREMFDTQYPDGYLKTFWPILLEQQERLIAKGVLKKDVCYGDKNDPFLNPDSFMGKLDRWIEKEANPQKPAQAKKKKTK